MAPTDLPAVLQVQHTCYEAAFHEPLDAFAAKLEATPSTCWVCTRHDQVQGYFVTLPASPEALPALHATTWQPPARAEALYLHDMALAPAVRGHGLVPQLLHAAEQAALQQQLSRLCLIAVQGSAPYWARHGFSQPAKLLPVVAAKLRTFGDAATYMERLL